MPPRGPIQGVGADSPQGAGERDALSHRYNRAGGQYGTEKIATYGPALATAIPREAHGRAPPAARLAAMQGDSAAKTALFPGTFDPLTNGHLDVIRRGQHLFDRLVVAIGLNPAKKEIFSVDERQDMIREIVAAECGTNVEVQTYSGLTVDFARQLGAIAILRGIRNVTDLNFEFQLALTNRAIADVETVFVMTGESNAFTSSTLIKQIASGGEIDRLGALLPEVVLRRLKEKKDALGGELPWAHVDHLKD